MNTLPLAEVVATVPPLPYLPDRRGRVWDGAGGTIAECHYQTPATSALLAHAPGALVECVEALERLANAVDAHCQDITTAALIKLDDATDNARAALARANQVTMP